MNENDKMFMKKILDKEFEVLNLKIKHLIEKAIIEITDKINFYLAIEYCKSRNLIDNDLDSKIENLHKEIIK